MGKLIAHLIVAGLIISIGRAQDWRWWLIAGLVVAGAVLVHLIWERLFPNPYVHLGAMPISNDDPLMVAALEDARRTWPQFVAIYPEHRQDSLVKFRLRTRSGEVENVWGDLLELDDENATVYLRTPPVGEVEIPDRRMVIPVSDVVDWQVEFRDGSLRGGFTHQATYRIFAREEGHMPPEFLEQLARYRPLDQPPSN